MTEEMIKGLSLSELKKEDFNKLKKWKEEEYSKIRSDLGLVLEGQKLNQKDLRLGFMCLKDIEDQKQITLILKTGVIYITITIRIYSSLFMSDLDLINQ